MSQKIIEIKIKNGDITFDALAIDTRPEEFNEYSNVKNALTYTIREEIQEAVEMYTKRNITETTKEQVPITIKVRVELKVWQELTQ